MGAVCSNDCCLDVCMGVMCSAGTDGRMDRNGAPVQRRLDKMQDASTVVERTGHQLK